VAEKHIAKHIIHKPQEPEGPVPTKL